MKFLQGRKGFETRLLEGESRPLGPGEVRLKVLACGVCGTDLHYLRQAEDFSPLGHEICALVTETGEGVSGFRAGQQVVAEDISLCGRCEACKSGRSDLCRSGRTMGGQSGFATELTLHESMLHHADGLHPEAAAMAEPLAVAIRCVETLGLRPGKALAIFGMGAIGLYCAAWARLRGAGRILMVARDAQSLRNKAAFEIARAYGADRAAFTGSEGWMEEALEQGPIDAAIVAAPPPLCAPALKLVGYGGRVLAAGVTLGQDTGAFIDINAMVFGKKSLLTSIAEPALNFPLSLSLIAGGRVDVRRAITHRLPLSEARRLSELYGQDAPAVKALMVPGP